MKINDNPNIIHIENITEEDKQLLISTKSPDPTREHKCPICGGGVEEQNFGYEKLVFCTHCEYSKTKTI